MSVCSKFCPFSKKSGRQHPISFDATISSSDTEVGTHSVITLEASHRTEAALDLTAPTSPGTYYYGACIHSVTGETNTDNNCSTAVKIRVIEPKVLIAASQRPPMYWINPGTGMLHRLVDARVENLLPSIGNATSLSVDAIGGKLYWTEKTGKHTGRIQRTNLDGSNAQLVKNLTSVPLHLTLDAANGELYLINSWDKIQRMNLDGTAFQPNLITGLRAPKGLAVDPAGGKVYWIEQTGERTGKISRANLDGSEVEVIKTLTSVPQGIALDATGNKVYITNAYGKVQRLNFEAPPSNPTSLQVCWHRRGLL